MSSAIYNFEGLVTLTLDRVKLHTVVHQSSTSTYMPNFIENLKSTKLFMSGQMEDGFADGHLRLALLGRPCQRDDLKMSKYTKARINYNISKKTILLPIYW